MDPTSTSSSRLALDYRAPRAVSPPGAIVPLGTRDFQRRTLSASQKPILRALAEAFFSPDGEVPPARLDGFVEEVDGFISPASKTLRFGLVIMLVVIRWSPFLFFELRPFEALTTKARIRHLERLERSKVTQLPLLVVAYKTIMTMLFYEDEAEQTALGYPGAERKKWKIALPIAAMRQGPGGEP